MCFIPHRRMRERERETVIWESIERQRESILTATNDSSFMSAAWIYQFHRGEQWEVSQRQSELSSWLYYWDVKRLNLDDWLINDNASLTLSPPSCKRLIMQAHWASARWSSLIFYRHAASKFKPMCVQTAVKHSPPNRVMSWKQLFCHDAAE
jgi:hypothetical protein